MALRSSISAGLLACSFLLACTAREPIEDNASEASGDRGGVAGSSAPRPMDIEGQMAYAKDDLAERLQVDVGDVQVLAARMVQWRSGAMGCPKPGMNYTMAIVPGVQVLLVVDKQVHHYHASIGREPFYCPANRAEEPVQGSAEEAMQET